MSGAGRAGREVELKLRVPDRAALAAVAAAAGGTLDDDAVTQVNGFFDTADRALHAARLTLRLRDEDGAWILTAKGAVGADGPAADATLKQHLEEEERIEDDEARAIRDGRRSPIDALAERSSTGGRAALVARLRAAVGAAPLVAVGSFTNRRARVPATLAGVAVVLELDETSFPGGVVHHEVEVEIDDATRADDVEAALRALLARAGVDGKPAPGKARRFFDALAGKPI